MRFRSIGEIIAHLGGKFPHQVYVGKDYSIADLIVDLKAIDEKVKDMEHDLLVSPAEIADVLTVEKGI